MSDIFVSYAREDREFAKEMASSLEEEGWSVWWDRTIPTGRRFHKVIEEALAAAKCVIVVWSKNSVDSDWVRAEAGEAMARNMLAPVTIDGALPSLVFRQLQTADLSAWTGDNAAPEFRKLCADLTAIASAAGDDETQPEEAPAEAETAPPPEPEPPAAGPPAPEAIERQEGKPEEPPAPEPPPPSPAGGKKWLIFGGAGLGVLILAAVGIWLATRGGGPQPPPDPPPGADPEIVAFRADPPSVEAGQPSRLQWQTRGADSVSLEGIGLVDARGSRPVTPSETTTYELVAANDSGSVSRQLTVQVTAPPPTPKPEIVLFEARPNTLQAGQRTQLSWRVSGAERVTLGERGKAARTVAPTGNAMVAPRQTTGFVLTAVNQGGTVTQGATVTVSAPQTPRVRVSKSFKVRQTWMADLDQGVEGGDRSASDFWFQAQTATQRWITPQNGATFAMLPRGTNASYQTCSRANLSRSNIPIRNGMGHFCAKTNEGRIAAFRLLRDVGPSPGVMEIQLTTWEK